MSGDALAFPLLATGALTPLLETATVLRLFLFCSTGCPGLVATVCCLTTSGVELWLFGVLAPLRGVATVFLRF